MDVDTAIFRLSVALLIPGFGKCLLGLVGFVLLPSNPSSVFGTAVFAVVLLLLAGVGAALLVANRGGAAAAYLAGVLVLSASAFADSMIRGPWLYLRPDAFVPFLLWAFAREFPRTRILGRRQRLLSYALVLTAATGTVLFFANAASLILTAVGRPIPVPLFYLSSQGHSSLYWTILFAEALPCLPLMVWRSRFAEVRERRRTMLFLSGIAAGFAPLTLIVLVEGLSPSFHRFMSQPSVRFASGFLVYPALLTVPVSTAYAVLVRQVLDVSLIVRRALQYVLAKYTLAVAAALPLVALATYVYQHRERTLAELLTGRTALVSLALTLMVLVTFKARKRMLALLDRRFFREQYDARHLLTNVVTDVRELATVDQISEVLLAEIERALHPECAYLLVLDEASASYRCTRKVLRPLAATSDLVQYVAVTREPFDVDYSQPRSSLAGLPLQEREWLAEAVVRLVVPLTTPAAAVPAVLVLGDKKSELPYSDEDRALLKAVAASVASAMEHRSTTRVRSADPASRQGDPARLCPRCAQLLSPALNACPSCGGPLQEAQVPHILLGKFRFEHVIGKGGMGVVYKATDLTLNRVVAIKALPRMSPEHAVYLRREARAMAALRHPNLAVIHGAESWRGQPLLIFEYLPGGNLHERIRSRPMSANEVLELGLAMSGALAVVHAAGIIHRDIKPSNIAYQDRETPKLLDFGLAHVIKETLSQTLRVKDRLAGPDDSTVLGFELRASSGRAVAGTVQYMSPECFEGDPAQPSRDIWALCLVLYEALAGRNPFLMSSKQETIDAARNAVVPDIRTYRPELPESIAEFLASGLARSPEDRPAALVLHQSLLDLRQSLPSALALSR